MRIILSLNITRQILRLNRFRHHIVNRALRVTLLAHGLQGLVIRHRTPLIRLDNNEADNIGILLNLRIHTNRFLGLYAHILRLLSRTAALVLKTQSLTARIKRTQRRIITLFLRRTRVKIGTTSRILRVTTLLTRITRGRTLFLRRGLRLLRLTLLFTRTMLHGLRLNNTFLKTTLRIIPLQLRQAGLISNRRLHGFIHTQKRLFMLTHTVSLALRQPRLANSFLVSITNANRILIRQFGLFRHALLTTFILKSTNNLLSRNATLLKTTLRGNIRLTLTSSKVHVLARTQVIRSILGIRRTTQTQISRMLTFTQTVRAANSNSLIGISKRRVIQIVRRRDSLNSARQLTH